MGIRAQMFFERLKMKRAQFEKMHFFAMYTCPLARSKFAKPHALNNMHVWSIHCVKKKNHSFTLSCFFDPKKGSTNHEKKGHWSDPNCQRAHFYPKSGPQRSPFRVEFWRGPEGSELAGHPVFISDDEQESTKYPITKHEPQSTKCKMQGRYHKGVRQGYQRRKGPGEVQKGIEQGRDGERGTNGGGTKEA